MTTTEVILDFRIAPGTVVDDSLLTWSENPSFTINPSMTYDGGGCYDAQLPLTTCTLLGLGSLTLVMAMRRRRSDTD